MNPSRTIRFLASMGLMSLISLILLWIGLRVPTALTGSTGMSNMIANHLTLSAVSPEQITVYLPLVQNPSPTGPVEISISLHGSSQASGTVVNGEVVTYTMWIANKSGLSISNIQLENILPESAFSNNTIDCQKLCSKDNVTNTFTDSTGESFQVTVTKKLTWTLPPLQDTESVSRHFTARVVGQNNGAVLYDRAALSFRYVNGQRGLIASDLSITVTVLVNLPEQIGLNPFPSWLSREPAAASGLDWGDFDLDGDLDLALATTFQISVYRNQNGRLEPFWSNRTRAIDAKWIQLAAGEPLALAVVGDINPNNGQQGQNTVFTWNKSIIAGPSIFEGHTFVSNVPLARIEAGNFTQTESVDLVVSALDFNQSCLTLIIDVLPTGIIPPGSSCFSNDKVLALNAAYVNNDDDLDLAIGIFPDRLRVLLNTGSSTVFNPPSQTWVITDTGFAPYDFAWGDYNLDEFPDLAVAYPLLGEIRVYRNTGSGLVRQNPILSLQGFPTSYALDWSDFNYDGYLDLVAVGTQPSIFTGTGNINSPLITTSKPILFEGDLGRVWGIRAVDINNDGSMELTIASRDRQSLLLPNFSLPLAPKATSIISPNIRFPATAVAWGDMNNDGYQDLIFGAGSPNSGVAEAFDAKLFVNSSQLFVTPFKPFAGTGLGPHLIAPADVVGKDGKLEIALATANQIRIYAGTDLLLPPWNVPNITAMAWGDMNGDGWLDLAAASEDKGIVVFINSRGAFSTTALTISPLASVNALAWGDFNHDHHLDLAASSSSQQFHIYLNRSGHRFDAALLPASTLAASNLAVVDYNGDAWPDIVLSTNASKVVLYPNQGPNLLFPEALPTTELVGTQNARITGLAWADADNDKDLDLAVAYDSGNIQAFANLAGNLVLAWESPQTFIRTKVAWGDADHDGDLDLAFSQDDGQSASGYFENRYIFPQQLLPNQPSPVWIAPPDDTGGSVAYASSKILSGPQFDPKTQRFVGRPVTITFQFTSSAYPLAILATQRALYEYSLDGGGQWQRASAVITPSLIPPTNATMYTGKFVWDAFANHAISDDARFRVQIAQPHLNQGRVQRASTSAISPPFRIRSVSCLWPTNPLITVWSLTENPSLIDLFGSFDPSAGGGGKLTFDWTLQGREFITHTIKAKGQRVKLPIPFTNTTADPVELFDITLTVTGEACPVARPVGVTRVVPVTLPGKGMLFAESEAMTGKQLPQITGLTGLVSRDSRTTTVVWEAYPPTVPISGYRVYVAFSYQHDFQLLATLPPDVTTYGDATANCGKVYYVTAFHDGEESNASTESFYSPQCSP